jgi:nucleotide sugar dehydrogenase
MGDRTGVAGLGYIGLPLVAALASVGHEVIGLDIDLGKVEKLKRGLPPEIYEPGLEGLLLQHRSRITFTSDYAEMMASCSAILVCVGTPVTEAGTPDPSAVYSCFHRMAKGLRKGHLIILRSTVVPGTTRRLAKDLEKMSGLKAGQDFELSFCPERTVEGQAIAELLSLPKIVGGISSGSIVRTAALLDKLGPQVIEVSSPEVAELSKLVDNIYRAVSIAAANEFGDVCERIGVSVDELREASNRGYGRTKLLRGGLGADGPCLTKDPLILKHWTKELGLETPLLEGAIEKNQASTLRPARLTCEFVKRHGLPNAKVAVVGVAFKGFPETDDSRDSAAFKIVRRLSHELPELSFSFCDPRVRWFEDQEVTRDLSTCLRDAHVVLLLTDHPSFKGIRMAQLLEATARPLLVVDCWRQVHPDDAHRKQPEGVTFVRFGDVVA